ncbi:GNAT family N-acetyltransferase [Butyricicoccus faecihominis]|uniref:GNAT family N-acetyltransferase n=1 Tax=Butyricicoccus faecihominis TaxID=1712515 RepID=UPI00247A0EA3|nr:GNAT family protein [Butyricicoccus faecihominis]MCQ5131301.1 GNAT family N-acetyltransferase [Butyricicoccus faecihominis]
MQFTLKKWDERFIDDVARYGNNAKIAANLRDVFPFPYTREDAVGYVRMCAQNDESRQLCRAIVADGRAVGSVGVFCGSDVYRKSAELGYWLAEEYWGKGIMTEAAKQLCAAAFAAFDIVRIEAEPFAYNQGSRRVLEKAGFTLEGVKRQSVFKNGAIQDSCVYALLRI